MTLLRTATAFAFLVLMSVTGPRLAQADEAAQATINGQIEAFLADRYDDAYSYAAPNVKRFFPTVDRFMDMVRGGYQPVFRPQDWSFGRTQQLADGTQVQEVLLTDQAGKNWTAIYTLQTVDGVWKITGVSLRGSNALTM